MSEVVGIMFQKQQNLKICQCDRNFNFVCSVLDSGKNRKRTKNLIFEYQKHVEENALPKPGLFIPNSSSTNSLPIPDRAPETESSNNTITEASSTSISVTTTIVEQNKTAENDNTSTTKDNVFEIRKELSSNSAIEQSKIDEADVEDDSGKNDISKNTDLFKAIFLSSSESEAEDDDKEQEKEQKQKKDELLSNVLLDQLVPKIRPIKEGILSNIDFKAFQSSKAPEKAASPEPPPQPDPNIFGPSLPTNKVATLMLPTAARDRKEVDDDEWVEKSETRKEKKHKSHKHKKKHKHKHKR